MAETYHRSKADIYHYILSFCTVQNYHKSLGVASVDDSHLFYSVHKHGILKPGDLCLLGSIMSPTKYILSWFVESRPLSNGDTEYLLKSIEDGKLCWWSNVSISYLSRITVDRFPMWKWTDQQYDLEDKWRNAVSSETGKKIKTPVFNEDGSVILATRNYFDNETIQSFTVCNWQKVKLSELKQLLKSNKNGK